MLAFNLKKDKQFDFTAQIPTTGICAVFGDSGAGKTSLVRALIGLEKSFTGHVSFNGQDWQNNSLFIKTEKRRIGMVFQEPRLFPHLDTLGNLKIGQAKEALYSLAELATLLDFEKLLTKKSVALSGGQKQRIAIARAILTNPQLLIMDEPLSSLDKHSRAVLLPFLKQLAQQIPIIYITHSMHELFYLATHMVLINNGRVEATGEPSTLFIDPNLSLVKHAHSGLLLKVNNLSWDKNHDMLQGSIDGQTILLTRNVLPEERSIHIKIESKDIIIATKMFTHCSLQNCLHTTIEKIESLGSGQVLLTLKLKEQNLLAKITKKSLNELNLKVGQLVYSYIKAVSIIGDTL